VSGWSFYAIGTPAPQGSKRHVGHGIMVESSKQVRPWREAVKAAAFGAGCCLDGPLCVAMVFTLPRPKSARRVDVSPFRTPDLSKLARSTEDAITEAGLWADDARVADYHRLAKVWHGFDADALPVPGAAVAAVERVGGWELLLGSLFAVALADAHRIGGSDGIA
jgi:crossover junction endodeoxyribonuclease RusA